MIKIIFNQIAVLVVVPTQKLGEIVTAVTFKFLLHVYKQSIHFGMGSESVNPFLISKFTKMLIL